MLHTSSIPARATQKMVALLKGTPLCERDQGARMVLGDFAPERNSFLKTRVSMSSMCPTSRARAPSAVTAMSCSPRPRRARTARLSPG